MIQVLYSPERAMVQMALKKVLKGAFPTRDALNYVTLDMGESPLTDLASECLSLPLGYEKKAVVADNCSFLEKHRGQLKLVKGDSATPLLEYLENPNPDIYLYFLVYGDDLDLKGDFFKAFNKDGATISGVNSFTDEEWLLLVPRFFEKRGIRIEGRAINEIIARTKKDYALFQSEALKLVSFASSSQEISYDDVCALLPLPLEEDVFTLSNALTRRDNKAAFRIYRDLKIKGVDEVYLLNLLSTQYRFLDQVEYLSKGGHVAGEIAAILHCSLGRANACLRNVRSLQGYEIKETITRLYEAEKAIMSGKMSESLAFRLFLAGYQA
jgi:DNA polymerase-3 subunit delta